MSDSTLKGIPNRLKAARICAGFKSSRSFAVQHSFPETTYLQHENGKRTLHVESLLNYSSCLGVNSSWILSGEGFPSSSPEKNEPILEYLFLSGQQQSYLPELSKERICTVDVNVLTDILNSVLEIAQKNQVIMRSEELVDFTYSVYNNIIHSDSNNILARKRLIELAASSLVKGNQSQPQSKEQQK